MSALLDSRGDFLSASDQVDITRGLVGVLGGMGPLATVDFMHKLLHATAARCDQEHIPALVCSIPQIPDRTAAFRGDGASPLDAMVDCGMRLKAAGANLIVMPCNTAHLWFEDIQKHVGVPMLHIVDAAIEDAVEFAVSGARIGLLATDATLVSGLYVNRRTVNEAAFPVHWYLPTADEMLSLVMPGISAVKAGELETGRSLLLRAAGALHKRGASILVLGCTEIPIVLNNDNAPMPTVDATAALAKKTALWSIRRRSAPG